MAFCVILLLGILLKCEGLEQSRSQNWYHHPPALSNLSINSTNSGENDKVTRNSETNVTQEQINKTGELWKMTTEELWKLRFPQWTPDDYDFMLSDNKADNNSNQNYEYPQNISTTGSTSSYDNFNITVQLRPVADGISVSGDNWGLPPEFSSTSVTNILIGDKLTSLQAPLLQFHVGVYSKAFEPYMQICGGTLVTTEAVISAAHCFWSDVEGALPASQFVVAAGKLYRPWNDNHDLYAQKSEVFSIKLPPRFHGAVTSFQDDIAVVLLDTRFTQSPAIRPLCVKFDEYLEQNHLRSGKQGVVQGWGLTAENGPPAQALQYLYMPYVPIEECIASSEPSFLKYITSDKICAGVTTGKALCRGDSGGGLVFFDYSTSERVPFLFGIASTAPRNTHLCNTHARATLTRVLSHRLFLRTHIPDIEEACTNNYVTLAKDTEYGSSEDRTAATQPPPANIKLVCNCYCNNTSTP
ncbi:coagulation factor IX-like [Leguminivora glycinivorella]|uniref:coagulation factor IX-like n=1 Tax=Leguminivora glycinivorella TaxID=1035111 RepID=UPI00200E1398|nr:coagulation factor IX-like [Leguminivora glycinivorella]